MESDSFVHTNMNTQICYICAITVPIYSCEQERTIISENDYELQKKTEFS